MNQKARRFVNDLKQLNPRAARKAKRELKNTDNISRTLRKIKDKLR
jgi:hypothetical protein